MTSGRTLLGLTAAAAIIALGATDSPAFGAFCSIDPLGAYRNPKATLFIGVATSDSLPGGPAMKRAVVTARDSATLPSPAFSQVVSIDRLGTRVSPELSSALRASGNRALVVPWTYGPDCSPITWDGKALWMEPRSRGLFAGELRPRDKWVNGIPTFDVGSPFNHPYPSGRAFALQLRKGIPLAADDLMSFYDSIPKREYFGRNRDSLFAAEEAERQAMIRWGDAHFHLAARTPVSALLYTARQQSALHPWYTRPSPLAGTWRFSVELPGESPFVVYGRTQPRAISLIHSRDGAAKAFDPSVTAPFAYYLMMMLANEEAQLDTIGWPPVERQGYLAIAFDPSAAVVDSTTWDAGIDIFGATGILPEVPSLRDKVARLRSASGNLVDATRPRHAPGRIISQPGEPLRFELIYRDGNSTLATIRGERLIESTWRPR